VEEPVERLLHVVGEKEVLGELLEDRSASRRISWVPSQAV